MCPDGWAGADCGIVIRPGHKMERARTKQGAGAWSSRTFARASTHINASTERSTLDNRNRRRDDVARHRAGEANLDFAAGGDVTVHITEYDNVLR